MTGEYGFLRYLLSLTGFSNAFGRFTVFRDSMGIGLALNLNWQTSPPMFVHNRGGTYRTFKVLRTTDVI